ncbi:helix-turn-helix domain-containing protein [Psychrobacillus sp. FSL K6-1415]|uniref:helix-turn-helix domain-containing protein n=1 Tax=Psychrobacillus sp. FSL K6-1415 TaxID=2921544 RepID=UPI0030FAF36C
MKLTPESLQKIRTNLGITQGELARQVGVSSSFLSAIERNERRLTPRLEFEILEEFRAVSAELKVIIDEFDQLNEK